MKKSLATAEKIAKREALISRRDEYRRAGKKVGYTSGTFDLLHPGHVEYLEEAKNRCDLLIVGVNSDASVRSYKDPNRPVCGEDERARVIAALSAVDHVFIFDDKNNNTNVELLKPDFYFKAGDYKKSELTSAPLVESFGGKVEIISLHRSYSTSSTIERIRNAALEELVVSERAPARGARPAAFLDRDGTLIEHVEYLHEVTKFKMLPGVVPALKKLKDAGYALVVVTNQPGIGLGYFTKEDFFIISRELLKHCSKEGVFLDKIYYCPHSSAEHCSCRKPQPHLVQRAAKELSLDLSKSFFIGDTTTDMECAKNAGIAGILVDSGLSGKDGLYSAEPSFNAKSFAEAVEWILRGPAL